MLLEMMTELHAHNARSRSDGTGSRVAVVTAHPPGRGPLNEYGYHFVRHLAARTDVDEVVVLGDELPDGLDYPEVDGVRFTTCWRFNGLTNAFRIAAAVRREQPDGVVFNQHFVSYGSGKVASALSLLAPLLVRLLGVRTMVLQHNIVETVDLSSAGFGANRIVEAAFRAIGTVLTWLVLRAHVVSVTIPQYVEILRAKYRADNVVLIPHGTFDAPEEPDYSSRPGPLTVMTFGKFGTYKTVEPLIHAIRHLRAEHDVRLVIAGTDSPNRPGYLAEVEATLGADWVEFTGYVEEEDVPTIFRSSDVVVFPYTSTTGSSGVLHQAGEYGRAVALPDIGDFAEVIREEGYVGEFFEPDDPSSMATAIGALLRDPALREEQGRANHAAAAGLPLSELVGEYLHHLGLLDEAELHGPFRAEAGRKELEPAA